MDNSTIHSMIVHVVVKRTPNLSSMPIMMGLIWFMPSCTPRSTTTLPPASLHDDSVQDLNHCWLTITLQDDPRVPELFDIVPYPVKDPSICGLLLLAYVRC